MAKPQAASAAIAPAAPIGETIVGTHLWKIDNFSARTKDLGVGESIKSSEFSVGGRRWYIQCYPCGVDENSAGWVPLFLCLSDHKEQVKAGFDFLLREDDVYGLVASNKHTFNADTLWRCGESHCIHRDDDLESFLKDDCLQIRCDVSILRVFPAVPPPDLHRPLRDLLASGMPGHLTTFQVGGEMFMVHRGPPGSSADVAASPTSAGASSSNAARISADIDTKVSSHVLTIDGYARTKKAFCPSNYVRSNYFHVARRSWSMGLYPSGQVNENEKFLAVFLEFNGHEDEDKYEDEDEVVKLRCEFTLLTLAREIILSSQCCYAFTLFSDNKCHCYFPFNIETESLLGDSFHIKCDVTVVEEITPLRPPDLHLHFGNLIASQVGADVEFEVGSEVFSVHKGVLATRSTVFMAEFFGPRNSSISTTAATRVRIDDMEPRVFRALLHFIYTDALPEVSKADDKIVMAQGLLVAADRYAMERLKLICADTLCNYVNNAGTAAEMLELADKHGCRRLKEKCIKLLKGHFAKVSP